MEVGVYKMGGGKVCFLLVRYGFCSNNALYSASLSITVFGFIVTSIDT